MPAPLLAPLLALVVQAAAAPMPAPAQTPGVSFTIALSQRADRQTFHFENPSTFDTPALVPHAFDQKYHAAAHWLEAGASYRFGRGRASTSFAVSLPVSTTASDIDTFFDPSGDVITSGTDGGARRRAWGVRQTLPLAANGALRFGLVVSYDRATTDFLPADRVVTHSQPPSISRELTTAPETTIASCVGTGLAIEATRRLTGGWALRFDGDVLPAAAVRLTTLLPEKYPGQSIVFGGVAFGGEARVSVEKRVGRAALGVVARAAGLRGYGASATTSERAFTIGMDVRFGG